MKREGRSITNYLSSAVFVIIMTVLLLAPVSSNAASFTASKPKLANTCAYLNNKVYLKWSKVKGAKKYEIYRAKINPSTGKAGKFKKWASTKKCAIKKKAAGDYKYRVRAVNGKKSSKWSGAKRIFGAKGKIIKTWYDGSFLNFHVKISNNTKSQMGFVKNSVLPNQHRIYAIDRSNGRVRKIWIGKLWVSNFDNKDIVYAGGSKSIEVYTSMSSDEYALYKNCKFMIVSSFYPNPYVEPLSTQMALTSTTSVADSAIAGK